MQCTWWLTYVSIPILNILKAVVDQESLTEALRVKRIAGAGLDVTTPELLSPEHDLFKMDNVGKNKNKYGMDNIKIYDLILRYFIELFILK